VVSSRGYNPNVVFVADEQAGDLGGSAGDGSEYYSNGSPYRIQRHAANIRERKRMLRSAPSPRPPAPHTHERPPVKMWGSGGTDKHLHAQFPQDNFLNIFFCTAKFTFATTGSFQNGFHKRNIPEYTFRTVKIVWIFVHFSFSGFTALLSNLSLFLVGVMNNRFFNVEGLLTLRPTLNLEDQFPEFVPPGTGWPDYTPGTW
jgi:hypothetical protein